MSFDQSRGYIKDYALIKGIDLLINMVKELRADIVSLQNIYTTWKKDSTLSFENQIQVIFGTSAGDKSSLYLVHCLDKLNREKMSEFPHREYLITLTLDCISAINRAVRDHSHIWNKVQLHTILEALGTGHVVKGKVLPYYDNEEEEKEKKKKKERYVLEYKPD